MERLYINPLGWAVGRAEFKFSHSFLSVSQLKKKMSNLPPFPEIETLGALQVGLLCARPLIVNIEERTHCLS